MSCYDELWITSTVVGGVCECVRIVVQYSFVAGEKKKEFLQVPVNEIKPNSK